MKERSKTLIVITGPTGIGKSAIAIELAKRLSAEIISADSRQFFKDIPITTAAPFVAELAEVKHHFVGMLDLDDYYSASTFEQDALRCIDTLFKSSDFVIMCGGSMMYVDAVCNGIDDIPTVPDSLRQALMQEYAERGDEWLRGELQRLDPEYYSIVDKKNMKRVFHAFEICVAAGKPYSELRIGVKKQRPFRILKIGLNAHREEIFNRINQRVLKMIENGMVDEARKVLPYRNLNSLNTVGFKEMFRYFDGEWDLPTAIARIQKNTRVYAKKQLTWYQRDPEMHWIDVSDRESVCDRILALL